jgi:putative IMPACT (imprinted ancient) family translation regulator
MARAYALSVKNLLRETALVPYEKEIETMFSTHYNEVDKILYKLKQLDLTNYERDFGVEKVAWKVRGSKEKIDTLKREEGL